MLGRKPVYWLTGRLKNWDKLCEELDKRVDLNVRVKTTGDIEI